MSAINLVRLRDRVIIATDSATWDVNGTVVGFWPKAFPIVHMPAVTLTRGPALAPPLFCWALSKFATFDELVAEIEDVMPEIHDGARQVFAALRSENFDLVIAGYSAERDAFEAYFMTTFTLAERGCTEEEIATARAEGAYTPAPYRLVKLEEAITTAPHVPLEELAKAGITESFEDADEATILRNLTAVLELQRQSTLSFPGATARFHAVGGTATITVLDKTSTRQFVIHRWPADRVGELIKPTPIDWVKWRQDNQPSRLKRDVAERKAKKALRVVR